MSVKVDTKTSLTVPRKTMLQWLWTHRNYRTCTIEYITEIFILASSHHYHINTQDRQDNSTPPCCSQILNLSQHKMLPGAGQLHLKFVRRWSLPQTSFNEQLVYHYRVLYIMIDLVCHVPLCSFIVPNPPFRLLLDSFYKAF